MNTTMDPSAQGRIIYDAERTRHKHEVEFARGSVRFEGGILSDEVECLNTRYVAGEIGSDELTAAILASHAVRLWAMT